MDAPAARLHKMDQLPPGLLGAPTRELSRVLPGPTLIHLPGRRPEPLFVSVLLHGNEDTGLKAVQALLRRYVPGGGPRELPRALTLFIGNVAAARHGVRRLAGQPDYNRVWPGALDDGTPEHALMRQVVDEMRARSVFASVDVHNNTGLNPHYACINRRDHGFYHLATLFSRTVVYFTTPRGVQTAAFATLCPAVTLECGQPGNPRSETHALEYLDACLHLAALPSHPVAPQDIDLFHTVAVLKVPEEVSLGFGAGDAALRLTEGLDHLNFRELPAGTRLGWIRPGSGARIQAYDEHGREVGARYLTDQGGELRVTRPVMPSMLTVDPVAIRQDCLGYLMERLPLESPPVSGAAAGG
ncbi:MAG: peptidase M14 [Chromatiales bacterium 21-64-14]|nr:MAG: peptidase M14 [Chromatiales bacterium 21-64-14]HQU15256.1 succinylglutamate desuccinylase/aspartoacylase family protein [Gammaproteobacteria bacterium]